jgi:hypothetical protein
VTTPRTFDATSRSLTRCRTISPVRVGRPSRLASVVNGAIAVHTHWGPAGVASSRQYPTRSKPAATSAVRSKLYGGVWFHQLARSGRSSSRTGVKSAMPSTLAAHEVPSTGLELTEPDSAPAAGDGPNTTATADRRRLTAAMAARRVSRAGRKRCGRGMTRTSSRSGRSGPPDRRGSCVAVNIHQPQCVCDERWDRRGGSACHGDERLTGRRVSRPRLDPRTTRRRRWRHRGPPSRPPPGRSRRSVR